MHAKAMGGGGKGRRGGGKGGRGFTSSRRKGCGRKGWMERTSDRLDAWGRTNVTGPRGHGYLPPEEIGPSVRERALQLQRRQAERSGVFSPPPEDEQNDAAEPVAAAVGVATARTAALQSHRMVEGRRASGFEPQRNTFYVQGRPVQVFGQ